jgi:hypothetical protein
MDVAVYGGVKRGYVNAHCPESRLFAGRVPDDATMGPSGSTESKYRIKWVKKDPKDPTVIICATED